MQFTTIILLNLNTQNSLTWLRFALSECFQTAAHNGSALQLIVVVLLSSRG